MSLKYVLCSHLAVDELFVLHRGRFLALLSFAARLPAHQRASFAAGLGTDGV